MVERTYRIVAALRARPRGPKGQICAALRRIDVKRRMDCHSPRLNSHMAWAVSSLTHCLRIPAISHRRINSKSLLINYDPIGHSPATSIASGIKGGPYGTRIHHRRCHRRHDFLACRRNSCGRTDLRQSARRVFYAASASPQDLGPALSGGAARTGTFAGWRGSMLLGAEVKLRTLSRGTRTQTVPGAKSRAMHRAAYNSRIIPCITGMLRTLPSRFVSSAVDDAGDCVRATGQRPELGRR